MTIRTRVFIPLRDTKVEFVSFNFPNYNKEDIALLYPRLHMHDAPLVRLHSECLTGDVFGSRRCDCNEQLHEAMDIMAHSGGIILYLRQEGRDIGLYNKLDAYHLQTTKGMNTYEANEHLGFAHDARDYTIAAQMLKDLGITTIRLLSNNPRKAQALTANGINIVETVSTGHFKNADNDFYLETKRQHGHRFSR